MELSNEEIITDQSKILKEIQNFYSSLLSIPENYNPPEKDLNQLLNNIKTNKLNKDQLNKIEGQITIIELSNSMSKMKNNKHLD